MEKQSSGTLYRTYVLLLLTLVYMLNFIDRQIIAVLSPAIQAEMGFSDSMMGWLKGLPFAVFYCLMGIPLAWLADNKNRKWIVGSCVAIWSVFTALTGLAGSFLQMLLVRIGVGIGEAGGVPPSHSILSDLYPKDKRSGAIGVYSLGVPLGLGFSFFVAGQLVSRFGWRGTLIILGVSGLLMSLMVLLTVREPLRGQQEGIKSQGVSLIDSARFLVRSSLWVSICVGFTMWSVIGYATGQWFLDYLARQDAALAPGGDRFGQLMIWLGLIYLFAGGGGTYLGAKIAEWLGQRNPSFYGWFPAIMLGIGVPIGLAAFWVESVETFLILYALFLMSASTILGPVFSTAQTLAPINMRAMSSALILLSANLIGLGGGPTLIGYLSEFLGETYGDLHGLRLAFMTMIVPYVFAVGAFIYAGKILPQSWQNLAEDISHSPAIETSSTRKTKEASV